MSNTAKSFVSLIAAILVMVILTPGLIDESGRMFAILVIVPGTILLLAMSLRYGLRAWQDTRWVILAMIPAAFLLLMSGGAFVSGIIQLCK